MSRLEQTDDFYAAGRKLAEHIANSKGKEVSTATLQALIRDFLPQHVQVQEALRSIVARQDFLQLLPLAGSNQKGVLQRDALLGSLQDIYAPKTIKACKELINGLLQIRTENSTHTAANERTQTSYYSKRTDGNSDWADEEIAQNAITAQTNPKKLQLKPSKLIAICIAIALALTGAAFLGAALLFIPITGNITLLMLIKNKLTTPTTEASAPPQNGFHTETQASEPYHVRSGSPLRMPNNTGISNELLAEAILANAKLQCDSITGQNGGYEASLKRYSNYIKANNISNIVRYSNTFQLLSASLKEAMVRSGSCEAPNTKAGAEKVKEWLM